MPSRTIKILYFGPLAEITGKSDEHLEIKPGQTVKDLLDHLSNSYNALQDQSFKVAVDKSIVSETNQSIDEAAEIALLPPFSGG
ncbi:MoaD/ThiS family protein [Aquimarina brevivitae]|uniref:Molybdopterin synthase sulfur carrier subunit n=1 Tax=Aquimarina brevivitae TaxID=323412 RepID=A0A4V2F5E4_9FLAO|nr:MoaD/ThiS family protein [Aquimarina brevivitae]RZS92529.1 molybdopterin synthase sulfur carrier subunit [Aquimarina brevivitae]